MYSRLARAFAPLAASAFALAAWAGPALAEIMPHRAVYEMRLDAVRDAQSITGASGRMTFSWTNVCDGWAVDHRSRMSVSYGERGASELGWRYSAWESLDGTRHRFFLRRFRDGEETERLRGEARRESDGPAHVVFREPDDRRMALPEDTVFTRTHTKKVLRLAREGGVSYFTHLFDGTGEDDGLHAVNAVILKDMTGADVPAAAPMLEDVASWEVVLAFFSPDDVDSVPDSEQRMRLFANGVVGHLNIDYGDFAMEARLRELERLDDPEC